MIGDTSTLNGPLESDEASSATQPRVRLPKGYDDQSQFLSEMRRLFYDDIQFDKNNRDAAIEDLRFLVGDQWDDIVRQRREAARKPVLTINRLPAFLAQMLGNRRQNETTIKIVPDNGGAEPIARIREGLIRSIQKLSRAELAYDKAFEGAGSCGIGNFQVQLDYDSDDVFEQTIKIAAINDHLAVVWDRSMTDSTGSDAKHVFLVETLTKQEFMARWPWATSSDLIVDQVLRGDLRMNGWITLDDVRIVNYWRVRTHKRTLALMQDGSTKDITDDTTPETLAQVVQRPEDGSPIMRQVNVKFAQMYVCSGADVLEGPYELPISRVPVFRVPGWEISVGEWKHRWGLVRFLKDPQRLHNFWRSVIAEKIMQTPRAVWLAAKSAVAGREQDFRNSHLSDNPLLVWNDESGHKPERVPPAIVEDALLAQAEITSQDIKDVSNIHEANLGMPSNEVSGVAIMARQRVSDTGTIIYHDNLNQAIEQCGRVCNELIPFVYDTPRIIKVLGEDGAQELVKINDPGDPNSDIGSGKYAVSISTGPSYTTKRIEASEAMMGLANAMPQVFASAADIIVDAQDWPMKDKIAERIRRGMPPQLLDPKDMSPEQQAQLQGQQQQQQQAQQLAIQKAVADYMKTQSETAMNFARSRNFDAEADAQPRREAVAEATAASQASDRQLRGQLEATKVATNA